MNEQKPRRPAKADSHYRLHLLDLQTQEESYHCFSTMGEEAAWLGAQQLGASVEARLSLVEGPDCFYCRAKGVAV